MFFKNTTGAEDLLLDKLSYQLDSADFKELMTLIERMDIMVEDIKCPECDKRVTVK
jgi:hypothetical protein